MRNASGDDVFFPKLSPIKNDKEGLEQEGHVTAAEVDYICSYELTKRSHCFAPLYSREPRLSGNYGIR